jgi:hypothetical protein
LRAPASPLRTALTALLVTSALLGCRAPTVAAHKPPEKPALQASNLISEHGYQVELVDETGDEPHAAELRAWLTRAVQSVSETTGGASERLRVVAQPGRGGASTYGRVITLKLLPGSRPDNPGREWVLHHELIHASFPGLPERDLWLEEGLATYLEPLVRVRTGQLDAAQMWGDLARDLPQGVPRGGEGGLAGTDAWHRLYWQGAVFWLNAELVIDRRSHGQRSLHDALCSWARADGSGDDWSTERAFSIMDAALGEPILLELYRKASTNGIEQQPSELLAELGVVSTQAGVRFAADAPGANLRRRMTLVSPRPCVR